MSSASPVTEACTKWRHSKPQPALYCGSRHPFCLSSGWFQACRGLGLTKAHGEAPDGAISGTPLGLSFLFCEVEIMSPAGGNAHKWPKQGAAHGGCFLFPDCFLRSLSNMCVDIASFSNYWKRAGEEGAVEVGEGESLQRGSSMAGNCSRGRVVTEGVGVADIPRRIKHWPRAGISSQPLVTWSTPICQIPEPPA